MQGTAWSFVASDIKSLLPSSSNCPDIGLNQRTKRAQQERSHSFALLTGSIAEAPAPCLSLSCLFAGAIGLTTRFHHGWRSGRRASARWLQPGVSFTVSSRLYRYSRLVPFAPPWTFPWETCFYESIDNADSMLNSCLGMGPQPPLAAWLPNRRSRLDPIPWTKLAAAYIASFVYIPTRNSLDGAVLAVHHAVLAVHLARASPGH